MEVHKICYSPIMKRLYPLLLVVCLTLSLSSEVLAASKSSLYVNNAYFKGNGKYDIVVHDSSRDTLRLYVNDKNPVKAKVNKKGWATFQKVKLTGQSKLSFAKRVTMRYVPLGYIKYIGVDGKQVKLSDTGLKHSYDDFYAWFTSHRYDAMNKDIGNTYQYITSTCINIDNSFGPVWTACMQKGYKEYLRPDTFTGDTWEGDYSNMVGLMNDAIGQKELYGSLSISKSTQYKNDMQQAQMVYERLAITH